jgi:hypothetical protein
MVEYETVGIIIIIIGLVSVQIKAVDSRLKEEIEDAKETHKNLCLRISQLEKKIAKIGDKLGVLF